MAINGGMLRALLITAIAASLAAPGAAQDGSTRTRRVTGAPGAQAPTGEEPLESTDGPIELSTDLVNVLFSVTDGKNKFVGDIREDELVIKESGEQQEVFSFRRERNLPLQVAVLVDVSASQKFTFEDERRYAAEFLQKVLRPKQDAAAVLRFGDDLDIVLGMTARLERVQEQFNRLAWEDRPSTGPRAGATALYDAVYMTANEVFPPDEQVADPANVVRRAIVLLTDGDDTSSERGLKDAIEEALRGGVIVYSIGVGGPDGSGGV